MDNIIVRESSANIRTLARRALDKNWGKVAVGMMIYDIFIVVIPTILAAIPIARNVIYLNQYYTEMTISLPSGLYSFIFEGPFLIGMMFFMLAFVRKNDTRLENLFFGFEYFLKSFALLFMVGLFTFLWTLLFIVPGIIATYRYSMSFYIMADHPEKGVMECISESKRMMDGNKGKLFCLQLSFIGWAILAVIAGSLVAGICVIPLSIFGSEVANIIYTAIFSIPCLFLSAYLSTAQTMFYELASGNLVAKPSYVETDYNFAPKQEEGYNMAGGDSSESPSLEKSVYSTGSEQEANHDDQSLDDHKFE